jgi:hypothetical protein
MSYTQLKAEIDSKNEQINNLKLEGLNIYRSNLTLKNSHGDMKRLMSLIASNDIPRLSVLIKACLKQNFGVKSTMVKVQHAIDGIYRAKGFSKLDLDIGTLILRIGGPRLAYALNQAGVLPSKTVVSRALQENKSSFKLLMDLSLEQLLKKNLDALNLDSDDCFYSLKMDELACDDRIRWCPVTNQILGTCWPHKGQCSSYLFDSWMNLSEIKSALTAGKIHKPKEALVFMN